MATRPMPALGAVVRAVRPSIAKPTALDAVTRMVAQVRGGRVRSWRRQAHQPCGKRTRNEESDNSRLRAFRKLKLQGEYLQACSETLRRQPLRAGLA